MTEIQLKYYLSNPRFNVYLSKTNNNFERAYKLYKANIELSEAFYPILSIAEISLRNTINETLKKYFNDNNWFDNCLPIDFCHLLMKPNKNLLLKKKYHSRQNNCGVEFWFLEQTF
jgi:hypothetical protein